MNKFLLSLTAFALLCGFMVSESNAGIGKFNPDGFTLENENSWEDEDVAIRVWILTAEQAENPPATKGEAAGVPSYMTFPGVFFSTTRDPGDYVIVASNETRFQSLADDDAFTPGEVFSAAGITLNEGDGFITVSVKNSEEDPLLPTISTGGDE